MEYRIVKAKRYFGRFITEFIPPVIVVAIISFISSYQLTDLKFTLLAITGFGVIWAIITHLIVRKSVQKIVIDNRKVLFEGTLVNSPWQISNKIENTHVKIKSQGFGRGNVEYYLKFFLPETTLIINRRKEWDYMDLIKIHNHFNLNKYASRNKELIDKMKMKAEGYTSAEIAFGKKEK